MSLKLKTFNIYEEPRRGDGLRIAVVRFLPRGLTRSQWKFDVWLPILAPSADLLKRMKSQSITTAKFFSAYEREMDRPDPRHVIELLGAVAERTVISLGCHCTDERQCHRSRLPGLIEKYREAWQK